MNQESTPFDLSALPPLVPTAPLVYDLNEIEHQFYMFDHRCVGCVVLMCTKPVDASVMGHITLSGKALDGCFWLPLTLPQVGESLSLVVPIRGKVDYDGTYTLRFESFRLANGKEMEAVEYPLTTRPRPIQEPQWVEHDEVALETARQGMVLLKNKNNVLPLPANTTLNLFGEGVTNYRIGATGAGRINPRFSLSLRDAVRQTSTFKLNTELDALYAAPVNVLPDKAMLERAKSQSDTAVIVLTRGTGENIDNNPLPGEYYLSSDEEMMIDAICNVFDKTVLVLNTGYPIDMRWIEKYDIKTILYTGLAGQGSTQALCEIFDGRTNPSGRLPDTWPWDYFDIPASANFITTKAGEKPILTDDDVWVDTCYEEGIYVGYRYFETFGKEVAFPFGHGLSYTRFEIEARTPVRNSGGAQVTATVTNAGSVSGREVVMVYIHLPGTSQEQPARQLVAFGKTGLLVPGESQTLTMDIRHKYLATYNAPQAAWLLEKGTVEFYVGGNVHEAKRCGSIEQERMFVISKVKYRLPCPVEIAELSQIDRKWPDGSLTCVREDVHELDKLLPRSWPMVAPPAAKKTDVCITYDTLKKDSSLLDAFVTQLDTPILARLNILYGHGWSMDAMGEAGRMAPLKEYGVPDFVCADGNCGVNVYRPNIGMPTSNVVCSTFNTPLAQEVGRVIGEEAVDNDIQMILAPGMNIHRNPLNGRHAEYFSEDPYLAGVMAAAQVQGLHDAGVSDSVKHVAANNCETARQRNHSLIGERALREIYLRAFEVLIDHVKPDTIMTSYNAINGCMCGSDPVLLEGIFREEFGFDGFAMSDWNSYNTVDMVEAVNAGVSWLTPGENDGSRVAVLEKAVADGTLTRERLAENVKRVFAVMLRRGFNTYNNQTISMNTSKEDDMDYICNPMNLPYKYQLLQKGEKVVAYREAADPSMIEFDGRYYLFPSMTAGFYSSADMTYWTFHKLPDNLPAYDYAPDVRVIDGFLYFSASRINTDCSFFRTKDPINGPYEEIEGSFPFFDPNLFQDDDGKLYFYWGASNSMPLYGVELDRGSMQPIGERKELVFANEASHGFERYGDDHAPPNSPEEIEAMALETAKTFMPVTTIDEIPSDIANAIRKAVGNDTYIEGVWMTKHQDTYYLQYAVGGTHFNVYNDAVYVSKKPLGPFVLAKNNPYSYKLGGFTRGSGHGSTMKDKHGQWWHISTTVISINSKFERRLGLWRAGFDADGELFCDQRYGDWPMRTSQPAWVKPDWMLLSYGKAVRVSSGKGAKYVTDESILTWWKADKQEDNPWVEVDLGKEYDVHTIQINFADDYLEVQVPEDATFYGETDKRIIDETRRVTRWKLEGSMDGNTYFIIEDKSNANTSFPHDLVVRETGVQCRYIRLTVHEVPFQQPVCVSGLRVFGKAEGTAPKQAASIQVECRGDLDMTVRWDTNESIGHNILWGYAEGKLYHSRMVFGGSECEVGALVKGEPVYVRVDAFNECGITEGAVVKVK